MKKVAFLFPGQGSQDIGMGKAFYDHNSDVKTLVDESEDILGVPIKQLMFEGPIDELTKTENAQPALLLTSVAIASVLKKEGVIPEMAAGHSLGEYSALVAVGALEAKEAVKLVQKRGQLMEKAFPTGKGAMAAVLGLESAEIEQIANVVSQKGMIVDVANYNCPGQVVISGTKEGVEEATSMLKEAGAKRVLPLNVSGPFHSKLMEPASSEFKVALDQVNLKDADVPVYANVTANPVKESKQIYDLLIKQLYSPVRFDESLQNMIDKDIDAFVEIGNGKVLSGLVRKVNRRTKTFAIQDLDSLNQFLNWYKGEE